MEQQKQTVPEGAAETTHQAYLQNVVEKLIQEENLPEKQRALLTRSLDQTLLGL